MSLSVLSKPPNPFLHDPPTPKTSPFHLSSLSLFPSSHAFRYYFYPGIKPGFQAAKLKEDFNIDLRVMGVADSRTMLLSEGGIDLSKWRGLMKENGELANLEKFTNHVQGNHFIPNTVLVDCTANSNITSFYYDWFQRGIHVITPNKRANSGPLKEIIVVSMK